MRGRSGSSGSIDLMVGREALLDSACGALRHRLVEAIAVVGFASQAAAARSDEQPGVQFLLVSVACSSPTSKRKRKRKAPPAGVSPR